MEWLKNLLVGSFQNLIADGQFALQREQDNERNVSLCEYTYTHLKLVFKFKTYGKQNMDSLWILPSRTFKVRIKWNRALKERTLCF